MDTAQSPNKDVVAACSQILPLMLESGLTSTVPEVQGGGFAMTVSAVSAAGGSVWERIGITYGGWHGNPMAVISLMWVLLTWHGAALRRPGCRL